VWMSSCSVFVFLSLMEFAIVNNYMGPVATKAMKGYSEEDITCTEQDFKVHMQLIVLNVNFCVMTPCNLAGYYKCFRGTSYLSPKCWQSFALPHGTYYYPEERK
jgi:hypothetical protein